MRDFYRSIEIRFEKLASVATRIYGNSLTFILAFITVVIYLSSPRFYLQNFHDCIRDIILCISFLSFFIIQKTVNRFSVSLQLKINELVAAHEHASNKMINIEEKTEEELQELSKHYSTLKDKIEESGEHSTHHSIDHILDEQKEVIKKIQEINDNVNP